MRAERHKTELSMPQFSVTQVKLIQSFIALAEKEGLANITLQKVADHADVAFGTVRYHFADENDLDLTQAAIVYILQSGQQYIESYLQRATSASTNYNGVESYIRGTFQWIKDRRQDVSFLLYYYYLGATQTKLVIRNDFFLDRARERLEKLLFESIGRGLYTRPANVRLAILQIHAVLVGAGIAAVTDSRKKASEEQLQITLEAVQIILH